MKYLAILGLFCCFPLFLASQTAEKGAAQPRNTSAAQWSKATDGLDFSRDVPEAPVQRRPTPTNRGGNWSPNFEGLGKFLQILAVLIALAVVGYGAYQMLRSPQNRTIARDGVEITVHNLEQYLHETDLDRFLAAALTEGNYPLAIRLYYLQTIKSLSQKNAIVWARDKTNRDYLRELRNHRLAPSFRDATLAYERVWYGNQPLGKDGFSRLEPGFKQLLAAI